jgi:hypothetical protein
MKNYSNKKMVVIAITSIIFSSTLFPITIAIDLNNEISDITHQKQVMDNTSVYNLLIITPDKFEKVMYPLVNHKNELGISTKLVTLSDVYEQMYWYGRDEAEKIKYFIKTAMEEWGIKYVLLIGGKIRQLNRWHIPVRYIQMDNTWESEIISDLYYADIYDAQGNFSSWDSDGDGLYGEWIHEQEAHDINIDLYPDVAVGRLPGRNKKDIKIIVKKIIEYEKSTCIQPWFKNMVVVAGDTYPESHNPNWTGYEGEYYAELALENMSAFIATKLYTSDNTFRRQSDVIKVLNNGCGFVYFVGHGSPQSWGNHPPNNGKFITGLNVYKMYKLRNNHKYPVCIVSGCHNCQFDVSIFKILNKVTRYRGEATLQCWGSKLLCKNRGGSIATIGCTALGFTKEDKDSFKGALNELEVMFFKQYGQNNIEVIGDTWIATLNEYINTYPVNWNNTSARDPWIDAQVVETWILFGDPSLKIGGYSQ